MVSTGMYTAAVSVVIALAIGSSAFIFVTDGILSDGTEAVTITFDGNGLDHSTQVVYEDGATVDVSSEFDRTGFELYGWNTAANGSGVAYEKAFVADLDSDITLYAVWSAVYRMPFDSAFTVPGDVNRCIVYMDQTADAEAYSVPIIINSGGIVNMTIRNLNINLGSAANIYQKAAISIENDSDVFITLEGENKLTGFGLIKTEEIDGLTCEIPEPGFAGIFVESGSSVTFTAESTGSLIANGAFGAAGIGSNCNADCGDITINGGTIVANGSYLLGASFYGDDDRVGAGIGSTTGHNAGNITINGGDVTATGSVVIYDGFFCTCNGEISCSNGIGTANGGNVASITIGSGANVEAVGMGGAADIFGEI